MTTHKLVPVEPTEAQTTAMELADDYPDTPSNHEIHRARYRDALAAAPNEGRVSREQLTKACDAALAAKRGDGVNGGGTNAITYAVIAALGLEIEGE